MYFFTFSEILAGLIKRSGSFLCSFKIEILLHFMKLSKKLLYSFKTKLFGSVY